MANANPSASPSISSLVSFLRSGRPRLGASRLVLVDGPAGSGKSSLADRLGVALKAPVVHGDDVYEGWQGLAAMEPILCDQILGPLSRGATATFRRWDWAKGERGEEVSVPPADVVVIEGVGVAQRLARPFASLVIYVDAPWDVRLARGLARDGEGMRVEWERWQAREVPFLAGEGTRGAADVVIDGTVPLPD